MNFMSKMLRLFNLKLYYFQKYFDFIIEKYNEQNKNICDIVKQVLIDKLFRQYCKIKNMHQVARP